MLFSVEIFKTTLGLVSFAALTFLLCSPQAFGMDVEEKGLKRKCMDPLDEMDNVKQKPRLDDDATIFDPPPRTIKGLNGLVQKAKEDNVAAQDRLIELNKEGYWLVETHPDAIGFMAWNQIQDRCYADPDYTLYVLTHFRQIGHHFPNLVEKTNGLAKQGNAAAQHNFGLMSLYGFGVENNNNKSFKYFKLSAKGNHALGQFHLSRCYNSSLGCHQDPKKSFKYGKLSADQGHSYAQTQVATYYAQGGFYVAQDFDQAFKYCKLSAEKNNSVAQLSLARMYRDGLGVNEDPTVAIGLLYKALTNQMTAPTPENQRKIKDDLFSLLTFVNLADEPKSSAIIDIDLEDFHAKTKVLSYTMGLMVARHAGEVAPEENTLSCKSLAALYASLADFGGELDRQAEIIKKNLKTPGFFITCLQMTDELKKKFMNVFEGQKSEFLCISYSKIYYYCIGDNNPALGYCFHNFLRKSDSIFQTIQSLKNGLTLQKQTLERLTKQTPTLRNH